MNPKSRYQSDRRRISIGYEVKNFYNIFQRENNIFKDLYITGNIFSKYSKAGVIILN